MTCLKYFVRAQIYAVKLALGELTFKQFKEITTFKITDFLIGKNRVSMRLLRSGGTVISAFIF